MAVVGILGHFRYILALSDKNINLAILFCVFSANQVKTCELIF